MCSAKKCPIMSKNKRPSPESFALPLTGVDTHAHLDMDQLREDIPHIVHSAREAGIAQVGNVFLGPKAYQAHRARFSSFPQVFFILGMHPHDALKVDSECLQEMHAALEGDARIKAVGEIGLDYYWEYAPLERQGQAFREQLHMARELELPVVIHSRDADEDTLDILDHAGFAGRPLLWHCFGGGPDLAQAVLQRGWMISIPGIVTFPKTGPLQEAVQDIPADRFVLETDCPFLAPAPYRGKRNEPALSVFTAQRVAEVQQREVAELWTRCGDNARSFFGLEAGAKERGREGPML